MPHHQRGVENYKKGNHQHAINEFTKSLEKFPNNVLTYIYRGNAYTALKEYEKAVEDYQKALEKEPANVAVLNNRAVAYEQMGRSQEAVQDYSKAIELAPKDPAAYNNRGVLYYRLKRYPDAIADMTTAVKLNPGYTKAYYNRANAYQKLKKYREADQDYKRVIELDPSFQYAYYQRGQGEEEVREYNRAIESYSKLIELNKRNYQAYCKRGQVYIQVRQFQHAIKDFEEAVGLSSTNFINRFQLARCFHQLDAMERSKEEIQKGIATFRKLKESTLIERLGYSQKQIVALRELITEYETYRDQFQYLRKISESIRNQEMTDKFINIEQKNDDAFLSEVTFSFKDPQSTCDTTQRSSMVGSSNQTTHKLRKELAEMVNAYRHEGYDHEELERVIRSHKSESVKDKKEQNRKELMALQQVEANKSRRRVGCCTGGDCLIY